MQYPFFAGTVDLCCRWAVGHQADGLFKSAHRLRVVMMAMYVRKHVNEPFITTIDQQVCL